MRTAATGADFSEFKKGEATHTGRLLATTDAAIGKIGPAPSGCGENWLILRCRPRLGITKAFVLRLASVPADEDLSVGAPA